MNSPFLAPIIIFFLYEIAYLGTKRGSFPVQQPNMIFKLSIIINCISREHSSKYVLNESLNVWLRIAFVTRKSPERENVFKPMPVNGEENIFSNTSSCGGQSNLKNLSIIVQDPRTSYLIVNICSLSFLKANGFYIYFSF